MPPKSWLKQNGPPGTAAPVAKVAVAQLTFESGSPMNMYSTLTLQLGAKAHSTPPPAVQVVVVSLNPVAMSQLPQPAAMVAQTSVTVALLCTKAAPPLA